MSKPKFTITTVESGTRVYRRVDFGIPGGVATPAEFAEAVAEVEAQLAGKFPVLLSGRGPVWGFAMLAHAAHATPAVATFDPRLGYVVVQSHSALYAVGDVIPLEAQS